MQIDNIYNNDLTIIVSSWDGAEELWRPFSNTFGMYWNDCPYEKVLLTQKKKDNHELEAINRIISFDSKDQEPIKRIANALKNINSKYVMIMCDDYFLKSNVNNEEISKTLRYMDANCVVDMHIQSTGSKSGVRISPPKNDSFLISGGSVCIYNRLFLETMTKQFLDMSMRSFEVNASEYIRINRKNYNILNLEGGIFQCYHCVLEGYWRLEPYIWIKKFDKNIFFNTYKKPNIIHSLKIVIKATLFNAAVKSMPKLYRQWALRRY